MRILLLFITLSLCGTATAQKRVLKQWDATNLKSLSLEGDVASSVQIIASNTQQLTVSATMEGEYANALFAGVIREPNGHWTLVTSFESFSIIPNDKLAAHKVAPIEIIVEIPADKEVRFSSKDASLGINGAFKTINATLVNGNCQMLSFFGNARLKVDHGNTAVFAMPEMAGKAQSVEGSVVNELPEKGKFLIEVYSITGDIRLTKIE